MWYYQNWHKNFISTKFRHWRQRNCHFRTYGAASDENFISTKTYSFQYKSKQSVSNMSHWCQSITYPVLACSVSHLFKLSRNTRLLISNPEPSKIMTRVKRTLMGISNPRSASVGPSCWNICWLTLDYNHVKIDTFQSLSFDYEIQCDCKCQCKWTNGNLSGFLMIAYQSISCICRFGDLCVSGVEP